MALNALHKCLSNELAAVLGRTLAQRHFLLLESMQMVCIRLVALHAEGEVLTSQAIKAIHLLRDRLHALIATEPQVITILNQLLLGRVLDLFCDRFAHLILKVKLGLFVIRGKILVHIFIDLLTLILQQPEIDRLIGLNLMLISISLVFIVPLIEHFGHCLIIDIRDELSLKFLLHPLNQRLILEEIALRQIIGLLDFVNDLLSF